MLGSIEEIISFLFTGAIAELDIPPDLYELAVLKYEEVGTWLGKTGGDGWEIYPQGSFRLGTVVRPSGTHAEYDIDLVCLWGDAPHDITPPVVKDTVGEMLQRYLDWKTGQQTGDGPADCVSSRRCWTLTYPSDGFHMDVLPAVPDDGNPPPAIRLTDVALRSEEMVRMLAKLAREANVADVPEWRVRTTLQRLVQVLKWHCATRFADDPRDRPPSILITTLVAQAYRGEQDLFTATLDALRRMGGLVENRDGRWWVANPVHDQENFADKWNEYPQRRAKFLAWLREVTELLETVGRMHGQGIHPVVERLEEGFTAGGVIRKAATGWGQGSRQVREAGGLAMTGTGLLTKTTAPSTPRVPTHTFFGRE